MNSDVKGSWEQIDPHLLISTRLDYFLNFSLIIATQMSEESLLPLAAHIRAAGIPLMCVRSCGLLGVLRVQVGEHFVMEKAREEKSFLCLSQPFPALRSLVDSLGEAPLKLEVLASTPPTLLLMKALDIWRASLGGNRDADAARIPSFSEDGALKATLRSLIPSELTPEEKGAAVAHTLEGCRYISRLRAEGCPKWTKAILEEGGGSRSQSEWNSHFWLVIRALRAFVAAHDGRLPLSGVLEDMEATSKAYTALERVYREQAAKDNTWVEDKVAEELGGAEPPPPGFIAQITRNSRFIALLRWGSLEEELSGGDMVEAWREVLEELSTVPAAFGAAPVEEGGEMDDEKERREREGKILQASCHPALWYLVIRAADKLQHQKQQQFSSPGASYTSAAGGTTAAGVGRGVTDPEELWNSVKVLASQLNLPLPHPHVFSSRHAAEVVRFWGAEMHSMAAFMGGAAAQEAIKLLTHQFVPTRLMVWSGVGGFGWAGALPPVLGGF